MKEGSKKILIWCDNCDTGFENENDLNKHEKVKHNKCQQCVKIFPSFESLIKHITSFGERQCSMCHKEFGSSYELDRHEDKYRDKETPITYLGTPSGFKCETCGEKTISRKYASIHSFCHNTPEILEGIRKHKGDVFQFMRKISPEIISDIMI